MKHTKKVTKECPECQGYGRAEYGGCGRQCCPGNWEKCHRCKGKKVVVVTYKRRTVWEEQ